MGGLGRASSRRAEQSSRGGRRAGQAATLQQHDLSILIVGPNQLKYRLSRIRKPKSRVIGHHVWVGGQFQERRTDVLSSGVASLAPGMAPSAGQVAAWAPSLRRLTPQVVAQAGRPHCHLSGPAAQERVKATSKRAHAQDSGTLAYLLELSPIFASCHHRFCIEDFPSPNPSRFKPRPYRGISIKNRDKTNTTWPTKNSSHNESNPHLSAL